MVVVFAACALVTPIAFPLVELFYGKQFLSTASLLIILIWSEVPVFFGLVLSNALIAKRLQKYTAYAAVVGAVVNVLLNLLLIPRFGAMGASWATVISYTRREHPDSGADKAGPSNDLAGIESGGAPLFAVAGDRMGNATDGDGVWVETAHCRGRVCLGRVGDWRCDQTRLRPPSDHATVA